MSPPASVPKTLAAIVVILGCVLVFTAHIALTGLGVHRSASSITLTTTAVLLVGTPPLLALGLARTHRTLWGFGVAALWSLGLLLALPVYFPGERNRAITTGLSLYWPAGPWPHLTQTMAQRLPPEPELATPEPPLAKALPVQVPMASIPLTDDEITLPYEGQGRRISVEVAVIHQQREAELTMMLDTGATYTTLPTDLLTELGVVFSDRDPHIRLSTANGTRDARMVLVDEVWLGHRVLRQVAIAVCDECGSGDSVGLLGLNVTGGYNISINADNKDVRFTSRDAFSRHLDAKPFTDIHATIWRLPGNRIEVEATLENKAPVALQQATLAIHCQPLRWLLDLQRVPPGDTVKVKRRLPQHDRCDNYQVGLHTAHWESP